MDLTHIHTMNAHLLMIDLTVQVYKQQLWIYDSIVKVLIFDIGYAFDLKLN